MISQHYGVSRTEEEGIHRYGVARSIGLFLQILERVDIIGDALHLQMIVLHFVLQCQHIEGMDATE